MKNFVKFPVWWGGLKIRVPDLRICHLRSGPGYHRPGALTAPVPGPLWPARALVPLAALGAHPVGYRSARGRQDPHPTAGRFPGPWPPCHIRLSGLHLDRQVPLQSGRVYRSPRDPQFGGPGRGYTGPPGPPIWGVLGGGILGVPGPPWETPWEGVPGPPGPGPPRGAARGPGDPGVYIFEGI